MIRDPTDIKNSNIWEKARSNPNDKGTSSNSNTVIVLGERSSGILSII